MIGIIGLGTVGSAIYKSFTKNSLDVICYDKYKESQSFEEVLRTEILFLCLPTLYNHDEKTYDMACFHEICHKLQNATYGGLVVIKSTVTPGTTRLLNEVYELNIIHNPEFLNASSAEMDFHEQDHIVIGKLHPDQNIDLLMGIYTQFYPDANVSICSTKESESMKMMINSFYAIKVQVFTEFYLYCKKEGIDFDSIKLMMLKNGFINPMHTNVPGIDGQVSYGGACLPKDSQTFLEYLINTNSPHAVLQGCVEERNEMRQDWI